MESIEHFAAYAAIAVITAGTIACFAVGAAWVVARILFPTRVEPDEWQDGDASHYGREPKGKW